MIAKPSSTSVLKLTWRRLHKIGIKYLSCLALCQEYSLEYPIVVEYWLWCLDFSYDIWLCRLLTCRLPLFFLRRTCSELEGVYSTWSIQLFLQQSVNHSMSGRLWFRMEAIWNDDQPKMCFLGYASFHGFMMGVFIRVIVDFENCRLQRFTDLKAWSTFFRTRPFCLQTFNRTASSTGVVDIVDSRLTRFNRFIRRIGSRFILRSVQIKPSVHDDLRGQSYALILGF